MYLSMKAVGIPIGIDANGEEAFEDGPSGAVTEHPQPAKTINDPLQKIMRAKFYQKKLADAHRSTVVECSVINEVLRRNHEAEELVLAKLPGDSACLHNASVKRFSSI